MVTADEIAVAYTPPGGWSGEMPPPILAGCTEPLVVGAPDLRGLWEAVRVEQDGEELSGHPLGAHVERVEQCGDRVVITSARIIHDMRADGTLERGVHDVAGADLTSEVHVAAVFAEGRLDLHPGGVDPSRGPLVTRELVGEEMVWHYGAFVVTLRRIGEASA